MRLGSFVDTSQIAVFPSRLTVANFPSARNPCRGRSDHEDGGTYVRSRVRDRIGVLRIQVENFDGKIGDGDDGEPLAVESEVWMAESG